MIELRNYVIRFFDRNDVWLIDREWQGADDAAALIEGRRLAGHHTIEIWEGRRQVARLDWKYERPVPSYRRPRKICTPD